MRKLVLVLIAVIAAVTFFRSFGGSLKAEEQKAEQTLPVAFSGAAEDR
jgi:type II secretory pathway pseudopilin PulG